MKYIIVLFILIILLSACSKDTYEYVDGKVVIGDITVSVAVADEPTEQATGLMHREKMGNQQGMLFIFPYETVKRFWMKNTLIPLDMIFISENLEIAKIQHAIPCEEDPCTSYSSEKTVMYVLEVNAGFTDKYNIKEGDKIEFEIY